VSLTLEALRQFAADLSTDSGRWAHLVRHDRDERVYEQIWADEDVNAWLICWSEDHDTGFHDHDESAAGIAVISGRIREERLTIGGRPRVRELGPSESFTVPPVAIHRVQHAGHQPAVTIHAYSPPLVRVGSYSIGSDGLLERQALPHEAELRAEPALRQPATSRRPLPVRARVIRRRSANERAEVAVEMRLVEVAELERERPGHQMSQS
jgi:mannose-6-phosphate isomerase-like protein (cupin superfamily)